MPTILKTDIGEFNFPNDLTLEEVNEWGRTELPKLRERVSKGAIGDLASRFPRDVAVGGSGLMMGLARGWQQMKDYGEVSGLRQMGALAALEAPVGEEHAAIQAANDAADRKAQELEATREQRLQENTLYQFGLETKANAQEFYKTNPLRDNSIPAMLSEGVASLPPLIASGAAGPLAPVVAGLAYGAMAGQQGAEEAIEMGQPEKADEAFLLFAGLGALSEAALGYPIAFLRKVIRARQAGVDPVAFGRSVKERLATIGGRTVREGLEGVGREGLQEGTEQGLQNVVASDIVGYDPERPVMQGVPQATAIGSVVGGGVGGVGGAAMAIDEARARRAAEAQIPAILRSIEQAQPVVPQIPATPEQRAAEAAGQPIPLNLPEPSLVAPVQPTAEEIAAEEAAAVAAIRARQQRVDPYFAEGPNVPAPPAAEPPRFQPPTPARPAEPRRRSPAPQPEPERPRFRPPLTTPVSPATIPTSEASAGLTALPVGEETGPTTRSGPPPARAEEGARETGTLTDAIQTRFTDLTFGQAIALEAALLKNPKRAEDVQKDFLREMVARDPNAPFGEMANLKSAKTALQWFQNLPGPPAATVKESLTVQLPPVPPGYVRMYHGGSDPRGELNGPRDITQYLDYAQGYADKNKGTSKVWYVDVPENAPYMKKGFEEFEGGPKSPWINTVAPDDVMRGAKEVPGTTGRGSSIQVKALPGPPEETPPVVPEAQQKGVAPNAIQIGSPAPLPAQEQTQARQEVAPQVRDAERPAVPQAETPQAQGTVDWFANLELPSQEEIDQAKSFKRDAARLDKEADKLRAQVKEIEKRILQTTGPRYERGKIKKSANKKDVEEYRSLIRRIDEFTNARRVLEQETSPAEKASTIRVASDTTLPLLRRLLARRDLFSLQGQDVPESFLDALDQANRAEVKRLFPDASPAEEERLRHPVQRAFMGGGDVQAAMRLDPELNLNVQRWGEIAAIDTGSVLDRMPEDVQSAIRKARDYRVAGRRELTPLSRQDTDRIIETAKKAKVEAEAAVAEEQRQAAEASAKMEREFTKAIKTDEVRGPQEAKTTLVRELEAALAAAPDEQHGKAAVTIEIPGDGTFRILNNKAAIQTVLDNARKLSTSVAYKGYTSKSITREQGKQFAEEARMTPEEIEAFRPGAKYSVTLSEPTGAPAVTPADIEAAFPASQGFDVRPVSMTMVEPDGSQRVSNSFLIKLPNSQAILVDPTLETIHFDPTKAAADWGLDPQTVAQRGVARGVYRSNGAALTGLSRVGLIELLNTSDPSTLSHEKFHALFDMALTQEERAVILDRYKTEEKAAEAFRRSEGFTRTFWEKIRRFIEWLANLVRGDAFRKLRQPLSAEAAQPTGRTEPQYSIEADLRNRQRFEERLARPITSAEEAASLTQQAGAGAGLVSDAIAQEIEALKTAPADTAEGRMATLLDFVLQLHGVAPALELQRILTDANIPDDTKQAAISNVLRQIEHVRTETDNIEAKLQEANKKLASAIKQGGKITKERLVQARAKQIADNLISRYRQYLTAQAANLPANQNLAAARSELINRMDETLTEMEIGKLSIKTRDAIEAIAKRIGELPVNEGPQAVIDAIRQKGILRGVTGETITDLLTAEHGGLPPLLLNPTANQMFIELADLQKKAETYAKQIEVIEQAFRGKGEPTPVELKKFADTYRKFRNKQADATKAIREYDKQFREADDDVQVYGRSHEILTRLQQDPQFQAQLETVLARPGGEILSDIYQPAEERKDDPTKETVFLSPLTHKPFRVHLSPTRKADNDTLRDMGNLKNEIDEFLLGENIDPLDRRTWEMRRAYIEQYLLHPQYLQEDAGGSWTNPFQWGRVLFGGLTSSLRAELESLGIRASQEADTQVRVAEQAAIGYKLLANNKEFGDAVTAVATIEAVKSHGWPTTRILFWNQNVLNPILASGQTAGQMRLKAGDYIPGTNIQITKQDMIVAGMEKRFSSGIVQTTQGTGKGLPSILRNNPILITDTFSGKPVLRGALSPGPLTMARSFSTWGRQFDVAWAKAETPEARRRLVNDGENFQMAALGFVRTTNPEFQNDSPLVRVYEQYAKNAKDNNQYSANSFDQLVDHLADIAVTQKRYRTKEQAIPEIEATLMEDIGRHVAAIRAQFAEDKINPQVHQTVMQYASAQNAFTKARKKMVAPDPYYDYTLTHESDRISFVGAGFQQFQLRIVASLKALQTALGIQQTQWDGEISDLYNRGGTEEEARAKVNKKTIKQIGDVRFSYEQLLDYKRRLDKLIKQLEELVIDVRDPNDSLLLQAVTRFHQTLSSGLLANPTAIGNNLAGGIISAKQVTLRNLGQAQSFYNPKAHARMAGAAVKTLLRIFPGTTAIGKLAKSNLPVVEDLSGWVHDMLLEQIKQEEAAESFGLRTTTDLRNRSRARGELMSTAGQIEYDKPGSVASAVNVLGSLPLVRQTMAQLRDKIPGAFDRWMNTNNANFYRDTLFENLKVRAINAFKAREEIAARTGVPLSKLNDFTREENLLTPNELEMPKYSGYRDSGRLRQLFNTVGSLDKFLLDYYNRWKKAPANEKANVPLFPDEADMGAVLHEIESHENLATAGFTPLSMQGVGQRGLIKKVLFMFRNYPTRMFTQMARLLATDPRDPKGWRTAYGWWSVLAVLIVSAIAGMVGKEIASPIQQAITGRSPSYVKLSNVMANPDAGMVARYVGMALASNLPYYGGVVSQLLGNPGYGTWLDLAEYIPAAGLIKDAGVAGRRMAQTGDAILPGADFVGRWFPPASPALRLFPSVSGDIERRNAERALRVVGPSAGMELAGGGGGNAVQTPASAAVRRLISAAYRGDQEGIRSAFDEAVREKTEAGSPDPERAVLQSLASAVPARRVFGKSITPSEEAQLTGLMSGGQRSNYAEAQNAFDLINQTLGTRLNLTSTPRARTRGQATRRALFSDSASPIFATRRSRSRRRRLGGRGRSAFRRLRIRGSSRRRRRSPARFSFAA